MPITKSAIKAMKQADKARIHNREIKANYRNKIKAVHKDIEAGGKNVAKLTSEAFSLIDKTAKNNIIHKKTAARRKSRLVLSINKTRKEPAVLASAKDPLNKVKKAAKPKKTVKAKDKIPTVKKKTTAPKKKTTKKAS